MGNLCDSGTKPDEMLEVDAQAAVNSEAAPEPAPEKEAAAAPAEAAPEPAPAAEAAAAAPAGDGSFTVAIVKAEGKTLKMGIKNVGGKAGVNSIGPDGLVAEYNAANAATAIQAGDIVESCNGATGDATAITDAIKAAATGSTISLVISRPPSKEFTIELQKHDGMPLKVGFSNTGGVMAVTSVQPDGLMAEYNAKNPATALKVGDTVLEVNGSKDIAETIKGTPAGGKLVMKCKSA